MAVDLSFFDNYKRAVVEGYVRSDHQTPFSNLDATDFYNRSFYNRDSLELEYKLLNMLVRIEALPAAHKEQVEYYIEAGARFLKHDADIADNEAESRDYAKKIAELETVRAQRGQPRAAAATMTEWQKSVQRFHDDLQYFADTRRHISKFIILVSYTNLYRLVTTFSRLDFKYFWTLASQQQWIDAQDRLFGYPVQRSALDMPAGILNFMSVAVFAARLAARGGIIYKHARSERPGEKEIDVWDRVLREFSVGMMNIMNDIAWVIINLLTNYAAVFGIADPLANTLLAMTLVWDCSWLVIHWVREERAWAKMKTKLETWEAQTQAQTHNENDVAITGLELRMLADLQLETRAKYAFMILAGLSITTSFLIFLAGYSAMISTICLLICVVGFAMYGSADEFGGMVRAYLGDLKIRNDRTDMAVKFFNTFTQTLLPPFIVMGLLSLGWQVAVLGALAAVAYSYSPAKWDCGTPPPGGLGAEEHLDEMDAGNNRINPAAV